MAKCLVFFNNAKKIFGMTGNLLTRAHFFWNCLLKISTQSQTNGQDIKTYNAIPQAGARNPIPKHLLVHFITNVHIIMLQCGKKSCSWPECKFSIVEALLQISKFDGPGCFTLCIGVGQWNVTLFFKISCQIWCVSQTFTIRLIINIRSENT
jgi:hypothetical protein